METLQIGRTLTQRGWKADDLKTNTGWVHQFTAAELAAIDRALKSAKAAGHRFETLTREAFPLTELRPTFDRVLSELEDGLGFHVLRGLAQDEFRGQSHRLASGAFQMLQTKA